MAAIEKVLTPGQITAADYPIAKDPTLGGEIKVKLSTGIARLIGIITMSADEVVDWYFSLVPTGGPLVAFVYDELRSDTAAVITYADITATFLPASYSNNQSFDFGVGRAEEFAGPNGQAIDADTVPSVAGAKRGSKFGIYELPLLATFKTVGCCKGKDIDIPAHRGKNIACGLDSSRHNKRGMSSEPKLTISALDESPDEGFERFVGMRTVALLEKWKEEKILVTREFCTNFYPSASMSNPEGEDESTMKSEGSFQHYIRLVAPGE